MAVVTQNKLWPTEEVIIKFERPNVYGWHTVVFPKIHDGNTNLEIWQQEVYKWFVLRGIIKYTSCYAHGIEKKEQNKISPVFFFKDEFEAAQMMWRFAGEVLRK